MFLRLYCFFFWNVFSYSFVISSKILVKLFAKQTEGKERKNWIQKYKQTIMREIENKENADKGKKIREYWYFTGHNLECLKGLGGNINKLSCIQILLFKLLINLLGNQIIYIYYYVLKHVVNRIKIETTVNLLSKFVIFLSDEWKSFVKFFM